MSYGNNSFAYQAEIDRERRAAERAWTGVSVTRDGVSVTVKTGPYTQYTWDYSSVANAKRAERRLKRSKAAREHFVNPERKRRDA